jgi:NAD(P)-dependent dehydrogenase (short-subunit alcohol dehydrogenase family)
MEIPLSGRKVLVTGASRGIGRAIAKGLALSGADVAAHFHRGGDEAAELAHECGPRLRVLAADLADPSACKGLVRRAAEALGGLDVLVNNAGVFLEAPPELPDEEWLSLWETTIAVNLRAPALLSLEAIRLFEGSGGGRIVMIASRAAFRGDAPEYLAYAASKGGMVALARSIARGFGARNVKAFVVAPGFTRTGMARGFIEKFGEAKAMEGIALDRMTEPDDLVPLVALLASGLADHATGCTIDVNAASYVR